MKLGSRSTALEVITACGEGQYLSGKTAVVTGGNSGIGLETVKALAFAGARVILCSRSVEAGTAAVAKEIAQKGLGNYTVTDTSNIVVKQLDLASLPSIKAFADDFLQSEQRLDLLVLNAGIMALPRREETAAGFEKQIGVNHFGHFYLTQLLQQQMLRSVETATTAATTTPTTTAAAGNDSGSSDSIGGRIVVLSSLAHSMGSVKPEDLHFRNGRRYAAWEAYGQSKMANLLFAKSLADKLSGSGVTALSVHPGVIRTNLWRQSWLNGLLSWMVRDKSIPQGAATTVFACVSPAVQQQQQQQGNVYRGAYLCDCAIAVPNSIARDESGQLREKLWQVTEQQLQAALDAAAAATSSP